MSLFQDMGFHDIRRLRKRAEQPIEPRYDGAIMVSRTQISLEQEMHLLARRRAGDLGVSLAEYIRRLVVRDLGNSPSTANPAAIFDLGASGESDIATGKDTMIAAAFASTRDKKRGR